MDDLTQIKGIGAATEKKLVAAGISSFAALAAATPDQLNQAKVAGGPDDWAGYIAAAQQLLPAQQAAAPSEAPASEAPIVEPVIAAEPAPAPSDQPDAGENEDEQDDGWTTAAGDEIENRCRALATSMGLPLLEVVRQALELGIAQLETPAPAAPTAPAAPAEESPPAPGTVEVIVTGPKTGRRRIGRDFTAEPSTPFWVDADELAQLRSDPRLEVTATGRAAN